MTNTWSVCYHHEGDPRSSTVHVLIETANDVCPAKIVDDLFDANAFVIWMMRVPPHRSEEERLLVADLPIN